MSRFEREIKQIDMKPRNKNGKYFYDIGTITFNFKTEICEKLNRLFRHYEVDNINRFMLQMIREKYDNTFKDEV